MHVLTTAGHVDHGKSALVRALTGMEPDRWAEERRRGMTLDLGFAWTRIGADTLAFVDVPGHERFVSTMLAGAGPVPAALIVVAADEGWMPQTAEHVAALDALGLRHAVVAVSRSDLAGPGAVVADVTERLRRTAIEPTAVVPVSAASGAGLDELRSSLRALVAALPQPDTTAPVRLWVDRAFTVRGSGTVVTGTLPSGTLQVGDEVALGDRTVRVRALQSLGEEVTVAAAVARVAVNLRGVEPSDVRRGDALVTPGAWPWTETVDVRLTEGDIPKQLTLHVGSAAVPVHVRQLAGDLVRLRLRRPLPLQVGDRGLLRDPGQHRVVAGVTVLDAEPPPLQGRGAAAGRGRDLDRPDANAALAARTERDRRDRLVALVAEHARARPLETGPVVTVVCRELGLAHEAELAAVVQYPLLVQGGRVVDTSRPLLPAAVAAAVETVRQELEQDPFVAPGADRLAGLGLGPRELAAAERVGALLRVAPGVVLLPDADLRASELLAALPGPFTVSDARAALGTTRRVAVPLLEHLDRRGLTRRGPDDRRETLRESATRVRGQV